MKYQSLLLLSIGLWFLLSESFAQNESLTERIKPLEVGDFLPPMVFDNTLFNEKEPIDLSRYKGSLLILDFWATWCAPCVASFPKIQQINEIQEGKVTILPVTYQEEEEVLKLFTRVEKLKDIRIPSIVGDNHLRHLFPHQNLPHYVWISPEGIYLGHTNADQINEVSFEKVLQTKTIQSEQHIHQPYFDKKSLFFDNHQLIGKNPTTFSVWSPMIPGIRSGYRLFDDNENDVFRISITNLSLLSFYKLAFTDTLGYVSFSRVEVSSKHADLVSPEYSNLTSKDWSQAGNLHSYELQVPITQKSKAFEFLRQDIERVFPQLKAEIQKKNREVWVLSVREPSLIPTKSKGEFSFTHDFTGIQLNNGYIYSFTHALEAKWLQHFKMPLVDETGIDYPISFHLPVNPSDPEAIDLALQKYGLSLQKATRIIPIVIIIDNQPTM